MISRTKNWRIITQGPTFLQEIHIIGNKQHLVGQKMFKQGMMMKACLKSTTKRSYATSSGVGAEPRGMAPSHGAIAAGGDLVAGDDELYLPLVRNHLPHDEAPSLWNSGGPSAAGSELIHHTHYHLPCREYIFHPPLQLPAPRRRREVLYNVLSWRWHLLQFTTNNENYPTALSLSLMSFFY